MNSNPQALAMPRLRRLKESIHFMNLSVQVCATAIGILLALGLDQWKTARNNRRNARQALGFIATELEDNRRRLTGTLQTLKSSIDIGDENCSFLVNKKTGLPPSPKEPCRFREFSGLTLTSLDSASWETAMASQAATHLDLWRIQKIAKAFTLQREFQAIQADVMRKTHIQLKVRQLSLAPRLLDTLTRQEAQSLETETIEWIALLHITNVLGQALDEVYGEAIQACK